MDIEIIKKYVMMFKIALIIIGATIVLALLSLAKIIPDAISYTDNQKSCVEKQNQLSNVESELQNAKNKKAEQEELDANGIESRAFYKDIQNTGNSPADILAGEVQEINDLLEYYNIKLYRINYSYDPEDDEFIKAQKDSYSVCKMDMELFSSYMKFQSFLKDLYKHEHFIDVQSIEISPYKKDRSILNIKMTLGLYADKSNSPNNDMGGSSNSNSNPSTDLSAPSSSNETMNSDDLNLDLDIQ